MNWVAGKLAIVTGATNGIGRATALLLAKEWAKGIVSDIDKINGKKVVEEIRDGGGEALFIKHDVSSESDWDKVIRATLASLLK